jgi:hypothetical protein
MAHCKIPACAGMTKENAGMTKENAGMTKENAGMTKENAGMTKWREWLLWEFALEAFAEQGNDGFIIFAACPAE